MTTNLTAWLAATTVGTAGRITVVILSRPQLPSQRTTTKLAHEKTTLWGCRPIVMYAWLLSNLREIVHMWCVRLTTV